MGTDNFITQQSICVHIVQPAKQMALYYVTGKTAQESNVFGPFWEVYSDSGRQRRGHQTDRQTLRLID